ncbi:BtrH N-terminal domain-containing protein [Paenibacillus piscarius]|uniref:BtrH N-terminal domain-containing protein n=1 Tax=Paenibacillus piscarius TaxID=1089681 RepID=UPI001EE7BA48|nr:BtrH N-terminal domain-containing protein [Paenibacillus piscarius]
MRKQISGFQSIPEREMLDCRITSFREILRYYGIMLDSAPIFLLSGGAGFQFGHLALPELAGVKFWFAGSSVPRLEEEFMNRISLPRQKYCIANDSEGWEVIKGFTDRDTPLLMMFDSRYITSGPADGGASLGKLYNPSMTVFAGYDTEQEEAYIVLHQNDRQSVLLVTSLPDFLGSRNHTTIPFSPEGICYELTIDPSYREWLRAEYPLLLKSAMLDTCERMIGNRPMEALGSGAEITDCVQGISGMNRLITEMEQYASELTGAGGFNAKEFVVTFLILRANLEQGSYTCSREEFGRSLQKVAGLYDPGALHELGQEFIEAGGLWRSVMRQLYNVRFRTQDPAAYLGEVIAMFRQIKNREQLLFSRLNNILQ